jgi:hypothetical protein
MLAAISHVGKSLVADAILVLISLPGSRISKTSGRKVLESLLDERPLSDEPSTSASGA